MKPYTEVTCSGCNGHGVYAKYSAQDFEGAEECDECNGKGKLILYASGRLAKCRGGPLMGSIKGSFRSKLKEKKND